MSQPDGVERQECFACGRLIEEDQARFLKHFILCEACAYEEYENNKNPDRPWDYE